jgi:hypothetical protein
MDLGDLGVTMGVMGSGVMTPLNAVRACGRGLPLNIGYVWKFVPKYWLPNKLVQMR